MGISVRSLRRRLRAASPALARLLHAPARVACAAVCAALALALVAAPAPAAPTAPPGFAITSIAPGLAFDLPTCMAFLPDGRALVGEKRGRVYVVANGARTLVWQSESEVLDVGDSGLESIAVDPDFASNRTVYLLYDVDPDSAGAQDGGTIGFGRLVRYTLAADGSALEPESRAVLMGTDWSHGPVITTGIHTTAALRFGLDGSLLVSIGDGSTDTRADAGHCPSCPPDTGAGSTTACFGDGRTPHDEDVGALRAQDDSSLCGKILRIDPATGLGLPGNPLYRGDGSDRASKVWAKGFRNPYRFAVRPGSAGAGSPGSLFVGDVGWFSTEELDVVRAGGDDFGWPCFEGREANEEYAMARPIAFACGSSPSGSWVLPAASWSHDDPSSSEPPGLVGNCAIGGAFYTGALYPPQWRGGFFFGDYGGDWLAFATFDDADRLVSLHPFASDLGGPTDFAIDPATGDLCYVAIGAGEVRRVHWAGLGNQPPVAIASASPDSGRAPLTVRFASAGSSDPEGSRVTTVWSFGDRTSATDASPAHTFAGGGVYAVVLAVSDSLGATGFDTVRVAVTGPRRFPSTPVLDGFARANGTPGMDWDASSPDLEVVDGSLVPTDSRPVAATWTRASFGADQEAYATLARTVASARAYGLRLKAPIDGRPGGVDVLWTPATSLAVVSTVTPTGSLQIAGTLRNVSFGQGDVMGARLYRDGTLQLYRNRTFLGSVVVRNWAGNAGGGAIGVVVDGASGSALDDVGGGDVVDAAVTPPVALILAPEDHAFYAAGDTVRLVGTTSIGADTMGTRFRWQVDTHHNNHVHPGTFVSTRPNDAFVAVSHDDGTGVFLRANLIVKRDGLADSTWVDLHPAVDLVTDGLALEPASPESGSVVRVHFALANAGPMLAPRSRWLLQADGVVLASGDTIVTAGTSVPIACDVPVTLAPGPHVLRVTADTLGAVVETDEGNDAATLAFDVRPASPHMELSTSLSPATPNPSAGAVAFTLTLPRAARVRFDVFDAQGRRVWADRGRDVAAGTTVLTWPGADTHGGAARAGLYWARIAALDRTWTRRVLRVP